jgi:signal transduction histidine kinase
MTPILGVAQLAYAAALQSGSIPPRGEALLDQMQIAVEEFIKRATKLLDVSRIEAGNLTAFGAKSESEATMVDGLMELRQREHAVRSERREWGRFSISGPSQSENDALSESLPRSDSELLAPCPIQRRASPHVKE